MAIPSKQIGQSAEANLLWQISKQLEILIKVVSQSNTYTTTTSTTTSGSTSYLLTEDNNELITENNDFIVLN